MKNQIIDPGFHMIKKDDTPKSKEYQEYQEEWKQRAIQKYSKYGPLQLDIELNTTCNYRCIMCFHSFDPPVANIMPIEDVKRLIDDGVKIGVKSLKLNYRGEPLMYPYLEEVISYAKKKGIIETLINTNGSLLDRNKSEDLIKAGLGKLICSIDGIKTETYAKIRRGGELERIKRNVLDMIFLRNLYDSNTPIIRVQIVEQEDNKSEIPEFLDFWISHGVNEIAKEDLKDFSGIEEDDTPLKDWHCAQLWQRLFILTDGTILPCCRSMEGGNHSLYILGNTNKTHIYDAWNGPKMTILRDAHRNGNSHKILMCRKCGLRKEVVRQNVHR